MFVEVLVILAFLTVLTVAEYIGFDQTTPVFQALDWKKKNDWIGRVTGIIGQIGMFLFAAISGERSHWGVAWVLAYFLHDVAHCMLYDRDITNYIHHIIAFIIAVLREVVMTPEQAYGTYLTVLNLESTSPFINATWLMREAGYKDHPAFKYLAGFTVVFFGLMRVLLFPLVMWKTLDAATATMFAPIFGLNCYWFYKIIGMAQRAFATNGGSERRE